MHFVNVTDNNHACTCELCCPNYYLGQDGEFVPEQSSMALATDNGRDANDPSESHPASVRDQFLLATALAQ